MTTPTKNNEHAPIHKVGRLARVWQVFIAMDKALTFDPIAHLEKRVRFLEDQLAVPSQVVEQRPTSNRAA